MQLANELLVNHEINNATDLQDVLKEVMGSAIETMLDAELTEHLDYEKHQFAKEGTGNRRNGTASIKVKSTLGEIKLEVPRDRDASFDPILVEKREKGISEIENKILSMYARGMSQRDIGKTIEEIYINDLKWDLNLEFYVSVVYDETYEKIDGLYVSML